MNSLLSVPHATFELTSNLLKYNVYMQGSLFHPVGTLILKLNRKLQGHYNYYGITGNSAAMNGYRRYAVDRLRATLNRRGAKSMTDETYKRLLKKFPVVQPKIVHRA